ncbi:MAG: hypothetical protein HKP41_20585 [Desulfobacterales bacterium]|nr:hypothetical protein [Deltaproteobacteria bacterium]NNK96755.1 hypothetical protein [Desulfobacterales bacterium]
MGLNDDRHLDVLREIEICLRAEYELHPDLLDNICVFGLENAKIAIKKKYGFAKNETVTDMPKVQGIIKACEEIGLARIDKVDDLSLKEYIKRIEKIKKSVKRHSQFGSRGYYDFIKNYV